LTRITRSSAVAVLAAIHCEYMIVVSRPVNKNVTTGTVIRAKRGTEPGVHTGELSARWLQV